MKKQLGLMAILCLLLCSAMKVDAQEITQTIRGSIKDIESQIPLIGATIQINENLNTTTDINGEFRIDEVPVGRHNIEILYIGYTPLVLSSILITSGKELVLNLEMEESAIQLDEVQISAETSIDKSRPLNTFATVSSRTFSIEETSRYAAASFDPARMALNYAGVATGASDDLFNEIIIRGNSPSGVLWRLEGIEIPNPNHFGDFGNSGGAISMLSSSTLTNSDFYTGAFPSEFGNATSGVFDLKMRNGNNEKRESSIMFGALGVELATEGPFAKNSKASYLVNYRYSTLALLQKTGINPTGDVLPTYQDLSFKLNFPTKNKGTISIFGLGGNNLAANNPAKDSTEWESNGDREGFDEIGNMGVAGLSHNYLLSNDSYLKTTVIGSIEKKTNEDYILDDNYNEVIHYKNNMQQVTARISSYYHKKLNAKTSYRIGGIYSHKKFDFSLDDSGDASNALVRLFDNTSNTGFIQAFSQMKFRLNDKFTLNAGLHYSHLTFNGANAIEPRAAISYKLASNQELTIASGLHSKMENIAVYSFEGKLNNGETIVNNKRNLGLSKSFHNVIGYDITFGKKLRIKAEAYYQYLYNIPVRPDPNESFSILNAMDVWDVFGETILVPEGRGSNVGIDLTIEKFFTDGYYFMTTVSIYDSKYKTLNNVSRNTRYNGNYQFTTLGGKEFKLGRNGKNIFGLNGKFVSSGGGRYTPIDIEQSIALEDEIFQEDRAFELRTGDYFRLDVGISFKINKAGSTHTIMLDIQNVTNRENPAGFEFDDDTLQLEQEDMTGLFPFFNYRVEF